MVSDSELVERLRDILGRSDLDKATAGSVRRQLEEEFEVDLSDRKGFIREQIDAYLQSLENVDEEEEGEEEEEEEEGEGVEQDGKESGSKSTSGNSSKEKKRRGGFNKLCNLSPQLQDIVGEPILARTEVVKRMWSYIREKNLQDPTNKRRILCDETLRKLFSVDSIDMFQMNKALAKHIWPLDESMPQKIKSEEQTGSASEEAVGTTGKEAAEAEHEDDDGTEEAERKKKRSIKNSKGVKKRGGGFNKPCSLSPQLQAVTGEAELARPDVVKKLWAYIREKNLQDPSNKQNIICDGLLRPLFSVDSINMFKMNKALSEHIWPLNGDASNNVLKEEKSKRGRDESDEDDTEQKDKKPKKGGGGLTAPLPLSDALIKFLGTGEKELSRGDVVKRMWDYIKENGLQDPSDKRRIICDDKLKELFEVDSFQGFSVTKLLTSHFIKASN
ncbi:hypothetical protein MLD38_026995 [Melastoma candidum]|uniref:Uncharacterized protein n=1 Tax=Melastoma candidum TaxID=119954 RepID=A0ACB9P031_9MYRT|nr:hypothetical protein MLD38_026995 [Melastoma candidum]